MSALLIALGVVGAIMAIWPEHVAALLLWALADVQEWWQWLRTRGRQS